MRGVVLLLALAAGPALAQDASAPLFRHATFGPGWTVTLGAPIDVPPGALDSGAVVRDGPGTYRLGFTTAFDGRPVDVAVTIRTDPESDVTEMQFDYGPGFVFDRERASYEAALGLPSRTEQVRKRRAVIWEDAETEFRLESERTDDGERSHSVLRDVAGE